MGLAAKSELDIRKDRLDVPEIMVAGDHFGYGQHQCGVDVGDAALEPDQSLRPL